MVRADSLLGGRRTSSRGGSRAQARPSNRRDPSSGGVAETRRIQNRGSRARFAHSQAQQDRRQQIQDIDRRTARADRQQREGDGGAGDAQSIVDQLLAELGMGGGGGGGGSARSVEDDIRLSQEEAKLQAEEARRQEDFQKEQDRIDREFRAEQEKQRLEAERQVRIGEMKQQRQAAFVEMMGRDPARAILFGMGIGPEADQFNAVAKSLGTTVDPIAGIGDRQQTTESALSNLLGGSNVKFGAQGITGLGQAAGAATSFGQGGGDAQKLLTSAFGVGTTSGGGTPGMSAGRLQVIIHGVTPRGQGAAGGR